MTDADTPMRRLIIGADVHRYSGRDPLGQVDVQHALVDVLDKAADQAGLDHTSWSKQAQGDAVVAVLPANAPEATVVADFVHRLEYRLNRNNRDLRREARLRLRVAIHSGIVHFGRNGFPGPGVVETCRLLDATPLKEALVAHDGADLGLIVSKVLFHDIVEPGYRGLRAEDFHEVRVSVKEYVGVGYVNLCGTSASVRQVPTPRATTEEPPNRPASAPNLAGAQFGAMVIGGGEAVGRDKITNNGGGDDR